MPYLELILFLFAAFLSFRKHGYTCPESISLGICTVWMVFSLLFQLAFLLGHPGLSIPVECGFALFSIWFLFKNRKVLVAEVRHLWTESRAFPWLCGLLGLGFLYLGLQALLLPEGNFDSMRYNLTRVLLFQQEKSLFLQHISEYHQAVFPVGGDILSHLFLRDFQDRGVALFSFGSYLSLGFGVYALARPFASKVSAVTASVVVWSLPLLVHQSTGTKPDILTAAIALNCLLLAQRLWQKPRCGEAVLLWLLLCFGVGVKTTFLAFAVPFVLCSWFFVLGFAFFRQKRGHKRYQPV